MSSGPTQLIIVSFLYLLPLVALVLIVRRSLRRSDRAAEEAAAEEAGSRGSQARETLDRRYAEGEVSREEYLEIREDITKEENAR